MKRLLRHLARALPGLAAAGLLVLLLRSADFGRALGLVHALGWSLPLLLLPQVMVMLAETVGWWWSFARITARPPLRALYGVRLASEALMLGLPSGSLVNDSMQPYLLNTRCAVALPAAIAAAVARKFFVVLSHGGFLALATALSWTALARSSQAAIGRRGLPWLLLAAAGAMMAVATGLATATSRARVGDRLHRALAQVGRRWLGPWLERNAGGFGEADAALSSFFSPPRAGLAIPILLYLAGWLVRSLETLLFLRLVGAPVSLPAAMAIETAVMLVRTMAVPVPGGIGVQDLGYVLLLRALGTPDATTVGAAFVVLKRGKDVFWMLAGFALLALGRWRQRSRAAGALPTGSSRAA